VACVRLPRHVDIIVCYLRVGIKELLKEVQHVIRNRCTKFGTVDMICKLTRAVLQRGLLTAQTRDSRKKFLRKGVSFWGYSGTIAGPSCRYTWLDDVRCRRCKSM
jgi:hypothetical protein